MDELHALREFLAPPEPPSTAVVQGQRARLMALVGSSADATPPAPRWRRRSVVGLVGVPAAGILLAAAGWAVLHDEARDAAAFSCVADGVTAVLPNDGTSPVEACRDVWEAGGMRAGVTTAPPLIACVDGRTVAVIEGTGSSACASAGMAEWAAQPDYEAIGLAVRAIRSSLHDRLAETGNGCATEDDWRSRLADEPATQEWAIDVEQIAPDRRCYDIASIDPTTRTLTLVGVPGDHSIGCDPRTGC